MQAGEVGLFTGGQWFVVDQRRLRLRIHSEAGGLKSVIPLPLPPGVHLPEGVVELIDTVITNTAR